MDIVTICGLKKYFGAGRRLVKALDGIELSVEKGRLTAVIGPSGSGKTTLLGIIGGLYEPTEGSVIVGGVHLSTLSEEQLTVFRRRKVGFLFQECRLIPELTVEENILFPLALDDSFPDRAFFAGLTDFLELSDRLDWYPRMLSGGQQKRVAIARALITKPALILADEPTGSLDLKNGRNIAGLLRRTTDVFHQTLVMVTHSRELALMADRVVRLRDGRLI